MTRTEEISTLLTRKLRACDELQTVTGLLRTALEGEEMEAVNRCLRRREALMRESEGLDRRIDEHRRSAPVEQHPAIDRLLADMSERLGGKLKGIVAIDQDCTAIATQRHEEMRNQLAAVRHQREGLQGYAGKSPRMPKFLNVRT